MLSKILKILVPILMLLLTVGIVIQYYISRPVVSDELVCYKSRLLVRVGDDGTVYTRVKGLACEYEKGLLIIEEQL